MPIFPMSGMGAAYRINLITLSPNPKHLFCVFALSSFESIYTQVCLLIPIDFIQVLPKLELIHIDCEIRSIFFLHLGGKPLPRKKNINRYRGLKLDRLGGSTLPFYISLAR